MAFLPQSMDTMWQEYPEGKGGEQAGPSTIGPGHRYSTPKDGAPRHLDDQVSLEG